MASTRFIYKAGTITVANGDNQVVGTLTAFSIKDWAGAIVIALPAAAAPVVVGVVAETDPRGDYADDTLPLEEDYNGTTLTNVNYILVGGLALASGATQATIYKRFADFIEQSLGLVGNYADIGLIDFSLVPENTLFPDHTTGQFYQWHMGVLSLVGPEWATVNLVGLAELLYTDETDSSEHASSTTESAALKTFTPSANTYTYFQIVVGIRARLEVDLDTKDDITWRIKEATTTKKTFITRLTADEETGQDSGQRIESEISTIIAGGGVSALSVTAQHTLNNANAGAMVRYFRVYGIKNRAIDALIGPRNKFVANITISGKPLATEEVLGHVFTEAVTTLDDFVGSYAVAGVAATSSTVFNVYKNGVSCGTVTFAPAATTGTYLSSGGQSFSPGDKLTIKCPTVPDLTLADIIFAIRGTTT